MNGGASSCLPADGSTMCNAGKRELAPPALARRTTPGVDCSPGKQHVSQRTIAKSGRKGSKPRPARERATKAPRLSRRTR